MTSTERARKWLANTKPLLTWAPLIRGGTLTRHAWDLPYATAEGMPRRMQTQTVCGIDAPCPTDFWDVSSTKDCESCLDVAAAPLAGLIDEAHNLAIELAAQAVSDARGQNRDGRPSYETLIEDIRDLKTP